MRNEKGSVRTKRAGFVRDKRVGVIRRELTNSAVACPESQGQGGKSATKQRKKGWRDSFVYTGGRDATRECALGVGVSEWAEKPGFRFGFCWLFRAIARVQGGVGEFGVRRRRRAEHFVGASVSKMESRGDRPRRRVLVLPRSEVK